MYKATKPGSVRVKPGDLFARYAKNSHYMMSLESDKLLLNFYNEAGLIADSLPGHTLPDGIYKGWESPTCQLRGHFLGHYLSACAFGYAYMGNVELKGRGDHIVKELRRCQIEHGNGWVFSIPEKYLEWIARGKHIWAPQYTIHKTLMGLMDMYMFAGSEDALCVARDAAAWFAKYSEQFTQEEFDAIMDVETGGMMEFFADLYHATGDVQHKALMERYYRRRLYDPMMRGEDVLTNMHANTTIPEVLGCARAYEVTGEQHYLDVALAYWKMAVTDRGYFVTGGQTCYEAWTPPHVFTDRLNEDNQEHCTVYNMIRLADFLFRHTGDITYHDYIERNYQNGILAQQHQDTGMVAYYLPMQAGARVNWGSETENFWCCHGTLVQAQMLHAANTVYETDDGVLIAQYRPVSASLQYKGMAISVDISEDYNFPYSLKRPVPQAIAESLAPFHGHRYKVCIKSDGGETFCVKLRIPWWVSGLAEIQVNGESLESAKPGSVVCIDRVHADTTIALSFPSAITAYPLVDDASRIAFMDGPDVLVGLTDNDALPIPPGASPESLVRHESRRGHVYQEVYYRLLRDTCHADMIQLARIRDEQYTLYFTRKDASQ